MNTKVKRNQIWRKKDTGHVIVTCAKNRGEAWSCKRLDAQKSSKKKAHHIKEHDLLKHYDLMEKGGDGQ